MKCLLIFFTKPLQGNLFRRFRAVLLSHDHIDSLKRVPSTPSKERVEDSFLKISRARQSGVDGRTNASRASRSKKPNPFGASSHSFQLIPL